MQLKEVLSFRHKAAGYYKEKYLHKMSNARLLMAILMKASISIFHIFFQNLHRQQTIRKFQIQPKNDLNLSQESHCYKLDFKSNPKPRVRFIFSPNLLH
jgi:hypothetical protein